MLSSRALLFAGMVALVGVVATWLQTPELEAFWRLVLVAALLAVVIDSVLASRIRVRGHVVNSSPLPLGRQVKLRIDLEASSARPVAMSVRTFLAPDLHIADRVTTLEHSGGQPLSLYLDVRAVSLADQTGLSFPARVLGPLGLAWWRRQIPLDRTLRVIPDPATRSVQQLFASAPGAMSSRAVGFGVEFQQLRPYHPGDPRRSIDWKASARSGSLITRDVLVEQRQEIMLFIDAGRRSGTEVDSLSKLGHYVNLGSQLIQLAASTDDQVGLVAFASQPLLVRPPVRAASAASGLQRALGGLAPQNVESNPLLAMLRLQNVVRQRTLIVVMADLTDSAATSQLSAALRLVARRHLPLVVDIDSATIATMETADPAHWLDPYVALAAQEFRQTQRANVLRLTRLGCRVLLTRPATAEHELAHAYQSIRAERRL